MDVSHHPDWSEMDLAAAQPYWILELLPPEELPAIACNDLAQGRDGQTLLELASSARPTRRDIGDLVERALDAMGVARQTKDQAWRVVADHILGGVEAGEVDLWEAAYQLGALSLAANDPEALSPFQGVDDYLGIEILSEQEWEAALMQEIDELRDRLAGAVRPDRRVTYGFGWLYWLRRYGGLIEQAE